MTGRTDLARDLAIVACAVSAGIHGALMPTHLAESTAAGSAFAASAVVLAGLAVALELRPSRAAAAGTAADLGSLLAAYALAVTTGVPFLHPEPEALDGLALFTKAVEATGLIAATNLVRLRGAFA